MKAFVALIIMMTASFAWAGTQDPFADLIATIENNPSQFVSKEIELSHFTADQLKDLQDFAESDSRVWDDTILEGDYIASQESVRLDAAEAIFRGSKLVAYKIMYSLKSWDTGSCELDYDKLAEDNANLDVLLKECELGRIYGSSYVDVNLERSENNWSEEYFE